MSRRVISFGIAAVVLIALIGGFLVIRSSGDTKHVTAEFKRVVGVYPGSSVRILGVPVGKVTKITPHGESVTVEMTYDGKYKVPVDASAAVVPPAIVGDRYIQLTPAFTGGAVMRDKATIALNRTQVPAELDEIFASLDQDIGPEGANAQGALSRLIAVGAKDLAGGNAQRLNRALHDVSLLVATLDNSKGDLVGVINHLGKFTTTLAQDDTNVRKVNQDLADVADFLAGEREDLSAAVRNLSIALGEIATLVKDNRANLKVDVQQLASITGTLVRQKRNLTEFLDVAPLALSNLQNAFDDETESLGTRGNFSVIEDPFNTICDLLANPAAKAACHALVNGLPLGPQSTKQSRKAGSLEQLLEALP
jgi:phospholipid/cholesterol/gamma-HCH transport system substrate-binding protein